MPDAGDFDRNDTAHGHAGDWAGAFAALPQETPDADGWQRLQARLPAPIRSRPHWPAWLASAAALALAIGIPLHLQPEPVVPPITNPPIEVATPPSPAQSTAAAIVSAPSTTTATPARRTALPPAQRPIPTAAAAATPRLAATNAAGPTDAGLERLYAESAQLEALLAMARDERVATGSFAALAGGLDAEVAVIDAAIIQPDLSDAQRAGLWRQRIDVLQQLVGLEADNRLHAARGQTYDVALVTVD